MLFPLRYVADDADEYLVVIASRLADRQFQWKDRPIFAPAIDFPSDADDPAVPRLTVIPQIGVVLLLIRRGHQHLHVLPDHLIGGIAEQAQAGRVAGLHLTEPVDD